MIMLLFVILIILAIVGVPSWGFHSYGYGPSGLIGVLLIVLLVLFLSGRL